MSVEETVYVYVIGKRINDFLTSPVKVGVSKNPNKRLGTLQTACPFEIDIAWRFAFPNFEIARTVERSFHETRTSLFGEWFDYEPDEATFILCLSIMALCSVNNADDEKLTEQILDACGVTAFLSTADVRERP